MENFYTAYTKTIDGVTFYFVKHFQTFPEYKNVAPCLENYGMHTDFYKACKIALIKDKTIQKKLSAMVSIPAANAKLIPMNDKKALIYNLKSWQLNLPGLVKLIHLR